MIIVGLLTLPISLLALSWLVRVIADNFFKVNIPWRSALLHSAVVWLLTIIAAVLTRLLGPAGIFAFILAWFLVHGFVGAKVLPKYATANEDSDDIGIAKFKAAQIAVLAGAALFAFGALIAAFAKYVG
jgi:hypothetical protein